MKDTTLKILAEKLKPEHISQRSQGNFSLSYVESHHAIREANRAFDFDGWSYRIIELTKVSEEKNAKGNHVIGYTARVMVEVGDNFREDVGFGSGISKTLADAHEGATKEAVSDAMKRALRTFGDIFGLALYDKKQEHVERTPPKQPNTPQRNWVKEIQVAADVEELKSIYTEASKVTSGEELNEIVKAKDKRKQELTEQPGPNSQSMRP